MKFSIQPEISVILPTFNRARLLDTAIQSVLGQTFTDWELLVVDDGSSDNTFDLVNPYITENPRIRYLRHCNRKLNNTRNAGIQAAFGRYITFLDSDDSYTPDHLESRCSRKLKISQFRKLAITQAAASDYVILQ
ncbi:glycosyltransferase family 2 protein [Chlorobium phaeobacteroides]|uniref:Glycosyltransferase involved in cell wall biogenesis-like protein n=1 Tax=Chlorobium phaeobacteroides (strain DSM 266 / SMG 266 / 2430) TaxID=290317 RepID=A1BGF1_CHLPD|nr:glycosyltransferase family 2 protein [Chlorobium phaeobacteroides]ABL65478.1 Glycosyltransferase involved in cell wall biogenesis-like protein [Chlorobium phaeobacteroides DSM 266]